MLISFIVNGCNKLEQDSINNILAMKTSAAFEFNSTSADKKFIKNFN